MATNHGSNLFTSLAKTYASDSEADSEHLGDHALARYKDAALGSPTASEATSVFSGAEVGG